MSMRELELQDGIIIPAQLLRATTSRSGGPGGQNVNKLETRVTIETDVDELPLTEEQKALVRQRLAGRITRAGTLRVTSQSERTQLANRDRALARMEELLREALVPPKKRKATRTPKSEKERRLQAKKKRSETKRLRSRLE